MKLVIAMCIHPPRILPSPPLPTHKRTCTTWPPCTHACMCSARTLAEQERLAASLNQAARTQTAIDFIVQRLVPEKLIAMARTRRSRVAKGGGGGAGG